MTIFTCKYGGLNPSDPDPPKRASRMARVPSSNLAKSLNTSIFESLLALLPLSLSISYWEDPWLDHTPFLPSAIRSSMLIAWILYIVWQMSCIMVLGVKPCCSLCFMDLKSKERIRAIHLPHQLDDDTWV